MKKLSFKWRLLLVTLLLTIGMVTLQASMMFMQDHEVKIFVKKNDQKTFYGLYSEAKADYMDCSSQLEDLKAIRNKDNSDITGEK